jgi:hypothetical protein
MNQLAWYKSSSEMEKRFYSIRSVPAAIPHAVMGTYQTLLHPIRRGATSVLLKPAPCFSQLVGLPGQDITLQLY